MSTINELNRKLNAQSGTVVADDTDPAFLIWYDGDETTASVSVHSVVSNTMRLIYGATTTDFLLSNSAYDTMGELQDAVNALDGWHFKRLAATRADATYSSDLKLLAFGATSCLYSSVPAGVTGYWDTSTKDARAFGIGMEFYTITDQGVTVKAPARTSMNTIPQDPDPIYNNYTPESGNPLYSPGYGAILNGATFIGGHGGYTVWTITKCTDAADGDVFSYSDTAATTGVKSTIGDDIFGTDGIQTPNGWIVVKCTASDGSAVTTPSILSVNGYITYCGG